MLLVAVLALFGAQSEPAAAHDPTPNPPGEGVVVTPSGLVLPLREIQDDGYKVTTPCWNEGYVSSGTHIPEVDVVLDPGHGGSESGTVGPNQLREKDLNLWVAQLAAADLEALGYRVLLTRTTDIRMPIIVRAEIARALKPKAFVSIHHNGGARRGSKDPGTETYHHVDNPNSERLAGILYREIHDAFSSYDIKWRHTVFQGANAIVRLRDRKNLYGLHQYTPGLTTVITEAAYLTTPSEAELLANPAVQAVEASAIARSIVRYLTTDDPGSGYNETAVSKRTLSSGSSGGCNDPLVTDEADPKNKEKDSGKNPEEEDGYRDVAGSVHHQTIKELGSRGIFTGTECGPDLFCPNDPIKRWEMAVWLVRALDAEPAPTQSTRFTDVDPEEWWATYAESLASRAITNGCATEPVSYCPEKPVTNAQMASFLARAFELTEGANAGYVDISNNLHSTNINAAAAVGLARACEINPPLYCPRQPVTRAQTATFLYHALRLAPQQ